MKNTEFDFKDYIRNRFFPHIWCPGCGHGIVLSSLLRAVHELGTELGIDKSDIVMVSGIGCSSRISGYVDFHSLHTLHGRALAFATGVKLAKPELNAIVPMGDGDALAIGGNHFIHAARRNIDITVVIVNNNIYGMTGGQYSPCTPHDDVATTMPYGNIDNTFDICKLAIGAGASFVGRTTAYHAIEAQQMIKKAVSHNGFSVVEVVSACPVIYGRLNKKGGAPEMMTEMKENSITLKGIDKLPADKKEGKIIRGIFIDEKRPEFNDKYQQLVDHLKEKK